MPDLNGAMLENTIQSQTHHEELTGLDILPILVKAGDLLPPYWSRARDFELSRFWMRVDHISSAFYMFASKFASIPVKVIARDPSIATHRKNADDLTANLNGISDFGRGWAASFAVRWALELTTQDNGVFAEVIGDAPKVFDPRTRQSKKDYSKPREGFYGLAILDNQYVQRTSSPEFPAIYQDTSGDRYKLHHSRVMHLSQMPSSRRRLNQVGFCALSRLINTAQHLLDISTMEQEELGSRPKRRMIVGSQGVTGDELLSVFQQADYQMDGQGLQRYGKNIIVGRKDRPTDASKIAIEIHDLYKALEGMDKEKSITLGMFLIALALGVPPRWLWPATSSGATKADAMYQHVAGMGGGLGHLLMSLTWLLGGDPMADALGKPIPPQYQVVFDEQDDEADAQQADIRKVRSETTTNNLNSGLIDIRTARLQALQSGDISDQQFEDMELADGRLEDGMSVLNLFYSTDPLLQPMLLLSEGDVLNPEANSRDVMIPAIDDKILEVRATLANPTRPKEFDTAKLAFAALTELRKLYTQPTMAEQQQGLAEIRAQQNDNAVTGENKPAKPEDKNSDGTDKNPQRVNPPANPASKAPTGGNTGDNSGGGG
jgi:hypothetical protein